MTVKTSPRAQNTIKTQQSVKYENLPHMDFSKYQGIPIQTTTKTVEITVDSNTGISERNNLKTTVQEYIDPAETNILKTALTIAQEENFQLKVEIEAFKILARNLIKSNRLLMVIF